MVNIIDLHRTAKTSAPNGRLWEALLGLLRDPIPKYIRRTFSNYSVLGIDWKSNPYAKYFKDFVKLNYPISRKWWCKLRVKPFRSNILLPEEFNDVQWNAWESRHITAIQIFASVPPFCWWWNVNAASKLDGRMKTMFLLISSGFINWTRIFFNFGGKYASKCCCY